MQNGTPLFALQELGGWESAEMVRRYAHLAADHLAPYAERLCAARAMENETVARFGTVPKTARACRRQALDCLVAGARFGFQRRCVSGFELGSSGFAATCTDGRHHRTSQGFVVPTMLFLLNQYPATCARHLQPLNARETRPLRPVQPSSLSDSSAIYWQVQLLANTPSLRIANRPRQQQNEQQRCYGEPYVHPEQVHKHPAFR